MANILNLGKKSDVVTSKPDGSSKPAPGGADIIFFPGVRYERESATAGDSTKAEVTSIKPTNTKYF